MAERMKKLAETVPELTPDERSLLRVAYREKVWPHRAFWRILWQKLEKETNVTKANQIREHLKKVEADISNICDEIVSLTENRLLPTIKYEDPTAGPFYYMMYVAEFKKGDEKDKAVHAAREAYNSALMMSTVELPSIHPIRLNVALNCSVFYYEILEQTDYAREITQRAYNEAFHGVETLDILNEEQHQKSKELLKLLRDNMGG